MTHDELDMFLKNIPKDMKRGEYYEWTCGCGGTARGEKSSYNGHLHAHCDKCGVGIME